MTDTATIASAPIIDYADAMDRFDGDDALYRRLAGRFIGDTHFADLQDALERNDTEAAYRAAHSLKGVAGNLSFTQLYLIASILSEALLGGDRATADAWMPEAKSAHLRVLDALVDLESNAVALS